MNVSNNTILTQLHCSEENKKRWLRYECVGLIYDPDLEEKKLSPELTISRRTLRLWQEITQSYLSDQYLSTVILTGAFLEGVVNQIREIFIEALKSTKKHGQINEYTRKIIPWHKWKDFEKMAFSLDDSFFRERIKNDKDFVKMMKKCDLMTPEAKGAWTEIKKRRNEHVHNNLERIAKRFQRDSLLRKNRIAEWYNETKTIVKQIMGNQKTAERKEDTRRLAWLYTELWEEWMWLTSRENILKTVSENIVQMMLQTQIDSIECIGWIVAFIQGQKMKVFYTIDF